MVIPRALREEAGVSDSGLSHERKDRGQLLKELAQVVAEIRQEAKEKGAAKMCWPKYYEVFEIQAPQASR